MPFEHQGIKCLTVGCLRRYKLINVRLTRLQKWQKSDVWLNEKQSSIKGNEMVTLSLLFACFIFETNLTALKTLYKFFWHDCRKFWKVLNKGKLHERTKTCRKNSLLWSRLYSCNQDNMSKELVSPLKGHSHAILVHFKNKNMSSHQWTPTNNGLVLLHWNYFLSSVATDGTVGNWFNLKKLGWTFQIFSACWQ